MSKIRLSGSNSGYVEIAAAADAGNLTFTMPTTGTALFGNGNNIISGITTYNAALDINSSIDVSGTSVFNNDVSFDGATAGYDVVWDRSDNALEFAANAKATFGASQDMQLYHDGNHGYIADAGTGNLRLRSGTLEIQNLAGSKTSAIFSSGGGQTLNFNNNAKFVTTNTGAVVTGICTATSFSGSGENLTRTTQLSHRNVIINGDMRIAQRATSHNSSGYRTMDRFKMTAGGASHTLTQAQVDVASGTSPYVRGFRKAFSITNAGQNANNQGYVYMLYEIEAQDIATSGWRYMYNSGGDDYITVSFWVKASVSQTYLFFIHTGDGTTKEWNHLMSLSANSWTKVTIPIPGNSGITINNDTGVGLRLYWCAYLGDHYTSTGSVDQWVTHAGYTSRPDMGAGWWTTSNSTFQLTGVQLEVGEQATPFEHRSFSDELTRCSRYLQIFHVPTSDSKRASNITATVHGTGSGVYLNVAFIHPMRAAPSVTVDGAFGGNVFTGSWSGATLSSITAEYGTDALSTLGFHGITSASVTGSHTTGLTGQIYTANNGSNDAALIYSAEF